MSFGLNMGITADKIEEATKGAIGLATAFKIDLNTSMKMVALANKNEFTMLNRYIPELRKAKTETEKMAIVQRKMADGFKLAAREAQIGEGPLIQMRNAIGDVKEEIGNALLPMVLKSARAIKKWAEDNQEKIGGWAETTVGYVGDVKDALMTVVNYMRDDWRTGLASAVNAALDLFIGFSQATAVVMAKAGREAYIQFTENFSPIKKMHETKQIETIAQGMRLNIEGYMKKSIPEQLEIIKSTNAQARKIWEEDKAQRQTKGMKERWAGTGTQIAKIMQDSFNKAAGNFPKMIQDQQFSWGEFGANLLKDMTGKGPGEWMAGFKSMFNQGGAGVFAGAGAGGGKMETRQSGLAAIEARFLTMTVKDKTEINTGKLVKIGGRQVKLTKKLIAVLQNNAGKGIGPSINDIQLVPANFS